MNNSATEPSCPVDGLFAFERELTGASLKMVTASDVLGRVQGSYLCSIDDLVVLENFNPRTETPALHAHIRSIADSILREGYYQHQPISVFAAQLQGKAAFYVTHGHCRLRAARLANQEGAQLQALPILLTSKSVCLEDLTVAFVRTKEGKKLDPLELAVCCKRLLDCNWTVDEIAKKIGFSPEYVAQLLVLAGAPNAIRVMVAHGQVPAAVALHALRAHGSDALQVLTEALALAQAKGKTKLTNRFMPEQVRRVAMQKAAPKMFDLLRHIHKHPSYKKLAPELKSMIEELVDSVEPAPLKSDEQRSFEAAQQHLPLDLYTLA